MNSSGISAKAFMFGTLAVLVAISFFYPAQASFILRFIRDLIVQNLQPLIQGVFKH